MKYRISNFDGLSVFIPLDKTAKKLKKKTIQKMSGSEMTIRNKNGYCSKEFSDKRNILLHEARNNSGCSVCSSKQLLQVHHKDTDTFNNHEENLQVLCFHCHSKHHKHMQNKNPPSWLK